MNIPLAVVLVVILVLGFNTLFWSGVGLVRVLASPLARRAHPTHTARGAKWWRRFETDEVAVLIPAHNEEAVLLDSLMAVAKLVSRNQIHVVSDGSSDRTVQIATQFGVNVLDLQPNRGKAGALVAGIEHFHLNVDYGVVLLLDADTRLSKDYFETGLPLFDNPKIIAVAGRVRCLMDPPARTMIGRVLIAYRSRLYATVQLLVKYGQAARWANVVAIVPGFASMYRTDILDKINITAPGLVIEDFNMTFEVHAKKLGRIAFRPDCAVAYTQDPDNWHDYYKQIKRWTLGYWQTVRSHGMHPRRFWVALLAQIAELISSSVAILTMLPLMIFAIYSDTLANTYGDPTLLGRWVVTGTLTPHYVILGFLLPDLALTIFASITLRQPRLLFLAPIFPLLRFMDAWVCLRTIPTAWSTHSNGQWISPTRREQEKVPAA